MEEGGWKLMDNEEAIRLLNEMDVMCSYEDAYGDMIDREPYQYALDMAIKALEQTKWISVSEKLPENENDVLVFDGKRYFVAYYSEFFEWVSFNVGHDRSRSIIAWMPIEKYEGISNNEGGFSNPATERMY